MIAPIGSIAASFATKALLITLAVRPSARKMANGPISSTDRYSPMRWPSRRRIATRQV